MEKGSVLKLRLKTWESTTIHYTREEENFQNYLSKSLLHILMRDKPILWQGSYYTRAELCLMDNIPKQLFYDRWHRKWSLERILLTPKQV